MNRDNELRIAVPRGALFKDTVDLLSGLGLNTDEIESDSRKLMFDDVGKVSGTDVEIKVVTIRPSDVPTYVEYGAAHIGITGKDVLVEQREHDFYEFVDLGYGKCSLVYATPKESVDFELQGKRLGAMRVASKYPRTTTRLFEQAGRQVEIIEVRGSVEIAPAAGLAEGIVDLTATGNTLKANGLVVREEIVQCSARLIANVVAHKLKGELIEEVSRQAKEWRDEEVVSERSRV